jgi:hypothetical protein
MKISMTSGLIKVVSELATSDTGPDSPNYMRNMVYECKVNRRGEVYHQIFIAARCMNGPGALYKIQIY